MGNDRPFIWIDPPKKPCGRVIREFFFVRVIRG
jgi:hypothetical protein